MEILQECNQEAEVLVEYPLDDGYTSTRHIHDVYPYGKSRNTTMEIELI